MTRPWAPGQRRVPGRLNAQGFHKKVTMSSSFANVQAITYECDSVDAEGLYKHSPEWAPEDGSTVIMSLKFGTVGPGVLVDLTRLTPEELEALKFHINESIERAMPIVQERERIAREAETNGDYSYERSNRGSPTVVVRPRNGSGGKH